MTLPYHLLGFAGGLFQRFPQQPETPAERRDEVETDAAGSGRRRNVGIATVAGPV